MSADTPIIFNGSPLCSDRRYGVHRYLIELLKELDPLVADREVELVVDRGHTNALAFKNIRITSPYRTVDCGSRFGQLAWSAVLFHQYVKRRHGLSVDLALGLPYGADVIAIHDCIRELYPQNANTIVARVGLRRYIARVRRLLPRAKMVITCSETSQADISRVYGVELERIRVVYDGWQHMNGIQEDAGVLDRLGVTSGCYYFSLGSRQYHKNFAWVVSAARQNPHDMFVVCGSKSLGTSDFLIEDGAPDNVVFTDYLSDGEIKALMRHCKAFVFPSLYEGFGIPPLEAMSVGAKCIVAYAGSLPEVFGDSVVYIDPHERKEIRMEDIMSRKCPESAEVVLNKYSWKDSAKKLNRLLREVS